MKIVDIVAAVLVVVGALNWGLVGVFNFDLVAAIFGTGAIDSRLVYTLVGVAGVFQAIEVKAIQRRWTHRTPLAHA